MVLAAAATALLLIPFWPFLTAPFWPTVWDLGGHRVPMREWGSWLAAGAHHRMGPLLVQRLSRVSVLLPRRLVHLATVQHCATGSSRVPADDSRRVPRSGSGRVVAWHAHGVCRLPGRACSPHASRSGPPSWPLGAYVVVSGLYAHYWSVVFGLGYLAAVEQDRSPLGGMAAGGVPVLGGSVPMPPVPCGVHGRRVAFPVPSGRLAYLCQRGVVGRRVDSLVVAASHRPARELAYLDMARWAIRWDAILMSGTVLRLAGAPSTDSAAVLVVALAGGAAVLLLAAAGAYRLARTVPDRRVLYPFAAMMAPPTGEQAGKNSRRR